MADVQGEGKIVFPSRPCSDRLPCARPRGSRHVWWPGHRGHGACLGLGLGFAPGSGLPSRSPCQSCCHPCPASCSLLACLQPPACPHVTCPGAGSPLLRKGGAVRCLWPPFGGFLCSDRATPPPISLCSFLSPSLWASIGSPCPASVSLGRGPGTWPRRCENDVLSPVPTETGLCLFFSSPALLSFSCLFLPVPSPSAYVGIQFPSPGKTVVLRAFLGHVPERSGNWDRNSRGLLSRASAALGISAIRLPFPSLFLLCPFMNSPLSVLPRGHPASPLPRGVCLSGRARRPLLFCLPAWVGCRPAPR